MTIVVHRSQPHDVFIGRPSQWGNPFKIGRDGTRDEVIAKYALWIMEQPRLLSLVKNLKNKRLGCYCHPKACHGDVLAHLANALL